MARNLLAALGSALVLTFASMDLAWAAEATAGEAPEESAQPAPLAPPPGISIIPSPMWRPPAQADGQVPGCPAGKLKPLDLLV